MNFSETRRKIEEIFDSDPRVVVIQKKLRTKNLDLMHLKRGNLGVFGNIMLLLQIQEYLMFSN